MKKIIDALAAEGYTGQVNDQFMAWSSSLGYTGAYNDRLWQMMQDHDLEGSVSDRLYQWFGTLPRRFIEFSAAAVSYVQLPSVIEFTGDCRVEMSLYSTAADHFLLGDSTTGGSRRLAMAGDGNLYGYGFVNTPQADPTWRTDNKIHRVVLSRTGTTVTFSVDGVTMATATYSFPVSFDRIFGKFADPSGINTFSGYGFDIYAEDNGTAVLDLPLDEDLTSSVANNKVGADGTYVNLTAADSSKFTRYNGYWLGPNLLEDSSFDNPVVWTLGAGWFIEDGVAFHDDVALAGYLQQINTLESGREYRFSVDILDNEAGVRFFAGTSSNGIDTGFYTDTGRYVVDGLSNGLNSYLRCPGPGDEATVDNFKVFEKLVIA